MITVREAHVAGLEAKVLLAELNAALTRITGASGNSSFAEEDINDPRAVFVVAYDHGTACGCGALRMHTADTAEIKRVYARPNAKGVGAAIVNALEEKARSLGYTKLVLETRRVNTNAVAFYRKLGYQVCENYGQYLGRSEAVCMQKKMK